eukprot:11366865-Ditylum_brightwellii.AAC.1
MTNSSHNSLLDPPSWCSRFFSKSSKREGGGHQRQQRKMASMEACIPSSSVEIRWFENAI